jgi:ubiquinone/menaquinone biosynthesis C-methylase UbiE
MTTDNFASVTEIAGQRISVEQLDRTCHRYHWALPFCDNKDALEVACGAGQGLLLLASKARSVSAGDISPEVLANAKSTVAGQSKHEIELQILDAEKLPFADNSFDTLLLFEAIYYVNANGFMQEACRVLRPGGVLLLVTANPALPDFNPSPFSTRYFNSSELLQLCAQHGFAGQCAGYLNITTVSLRQRVLRPVKKLAVQLNLMPKTMHGKEWLKKLFFGKMTVMPSDISVVDFAYQPPAPVAAGEIDKQHKAIYLTATKSTQVAA